MKKSKMTRRNYREWCGHIIIYLYLMLLYQRWRWRWRWGERERERERKADRKRDRETETEKDWVRDWERGVHIRLSGFWRSRRSVVGQWPTIYGCVRIIIIMYRVVGNGRAAYKDRQNYYCTEVTYASYYNI